jgi:N-acetylmuramoyl-L-alanine amidase
MPMIPYVVRPGDFLGRLAHVHGFDADAVWNHPANADLRRRRTSPEVLATGDILHIPDEPRARHPLRLHATNAFSTRVATVRVRVALSGSGGRPLANARYWLDGATEPSGTTDGGGIATIEVEPTKTSVSVRVDGCSDVYLLRIGHIEPADSEAGVRQRLLNLSYLPEDSEHVTRERVGEALRRFQQRHGLELTGQPDGATVQALVREHGS